MALRNAAPADQAERDRIQTALDETLFVEAGAGTGKTTALVGRIVALIESGVEISSIAAITFTEAAAAELRDRVRASLEGRIAGGGPGVERCQAAIAGLDAAAIQTLHGFARRILALYPLEAGLPPRFDVRDQVEADTVFEDRWADFLAELFADVDSGPRLPRALALELKPSQLRGLALALHANWDRLSPLPPVTTPPPDIDVLPVVEPLLAAVGLRDVCHDHKDKLYEFVTRAGATAGAIAAAAAEVDSAADPLAHVVAEQDLLRLLVDVGGFKAGNLGASKSWHGSKDTVIGHLRDADAALTALRAEIRRDCIEALLPRLVDWVLDAAETRRRDGTLEYHDLLVLAVRLLRSNRVVRQTLHARYTRLLIDEFQDTDPLQVELAALLVTTADDVGETPWQELPVQPGSLFFVGDPRQSIYRFRRADIDLYAAARETFAPGPVHLRANFRSRAGVIDWVNAYFSGLFENAYGTDPGTPRQGEYVPLAPHRDGQAPVVHVIGGPSKEQAPVIRVAEAADIALLIRNARDADWLKKVRPGEPTRFADITILIPGRNALPALERALGEAAIPFRIDGSTLLFGTQEVRDLTNILAAIDDPADEVAVVAALRSPAFACADDELYAYRQARRYGTWDYTRHIPDDMPVSNPVRQSLEALRALYERRAWLSIGELVEEVIRERRLFELAFANSRPRDTWQRLRFLHEHARRFDEAGDATLHHFVVWLQERAKSGVQLSESVVPDPDDDAVRIMTIHAAKGLEFPIVFVAGLLTESNNQRPAVLFHPGDAAHGRQPEVSIARKEEPFATAGYAALFARENVMQRLERDRLLYVATTRARDCLVVSAYHKAHRGGHDKRHLDADCTLAECLDAACTRDPALRGVRPSSSGSMPLADAPDEGPQPDLDARERWIEERQALLADARRPRVVAATRLAHDDADAATEKPEPSDDEHSPWRRGRAGTAVGRAVHAVLQTIDHVSLDGLADAARAQASAEGVPDREAEIARLVRAACASQPVRAAAASGRSWRELYVAAPVATPAGDVLLEGFVDLLYKTAEGYVVVDYKTDGVSSETQIDRAMQQYRVQGAAYALALEQQLGQPVVSFECVFVTPERVRSVAGEELRTAMDEARRRLASMRGRAPDEASLAPVG